MTILDDIVAHKKNEIAALPDLAEDDVPVCKMDFAPFFNRKPLLIAEIKAASPSEGSIVEDFQPQTITKDYATGGANAISVLTDKKFFHGGFHVLEKVRPETSLPLLCKDFLIDEKQVYHARKTGADLCLLIVKILDDKTLAALKTAIEALGMHAVIEVQNKEELNRALAVDPKIILINNRDLTNFNVDMSTTTDLLDFIPKGVKVIAASGIKQPQECAGYPGRVDGFLIGTALMRTADKVSFLQQCREARQ